MSVQENINSCNLSHMFKIGELQKPQEPQQTNRSLKSIDNHLEYQNYVENTMIGN